jgi:hypothetical protein
MDLISAHRDGLAAQLAAEAHGLAGRGGDHVQRAIVYHHLFDHSGGRHAYALLAAEGALAIEAALEAMRGAAKHALWRLRGPRRAAMIARIERFGEALAAIDAARCEAMWVAYRAAQHEATAALVPPALGGLREGDGETLFKAHQAWAEERWGLEIEVALDGLAWPLAPAPVAAAVRALRIPVDRFAKARRQGLRKVEAGILADKRLPPKFAANPAHHYYILQRHMAERRRSDRDQSLGIPIEETVRLAAAA